MRAFLALMLLAAGPVLAQGDPCDDAETQVDLNDCTYVAWEQADEALNKAWAEAMALAEERGTQDTLRTAQRAWIAFRDADCAAHAALWEGGSAQPMIFNGCMETLTLQRTDALWAYAEQ